jgi:hypothetical protein
LHAASAAISNAPPNAARSLFRVFIVLSLSRDDKRYFFAGVNAIRVHGLNRDHVPSQGQSAAFRV